MELRKKFLSVAALAFAAALSTGIAVSATAEEDNTLDGFGITGYSVRTENFKDKQGVEVETSTGLRFKTVTPDAKNAYEDAYTIITVAGAAEEADQAKVSAQVWRSEDNGWNTVLLGIPAEAYGTEITAQSYVVLDGQLYETEPFTISIDVAASKALNMGYTNDVLYDYTANTVESIALDKATLALDQLTPTATLTATVAPEKYSVVWASSNTKVATVDKDGKVTAVGAGTANITATMGGVTSEACAVTVGAMPITFENGEETAVVTKLNNSTATLGVVDFNGGKVFGTSTTGFADRNCYFHISYDAVASYFAAYPNAAAISFDVYSNTDANSMRVYTNRASNDAASSAYAQTFLGAQGGEKVDVDGTTYYKRTYVLNRALFENAMTKDVDVLFFYYATYGKVVEEFYVDNFGVVTEYTMSYDFEDGSYVSPVVHLGSSLTRRHGTNFATIKVTDSLGVETTTRALTASLAKSSGQTPLNSGTTYFSFATEYLDLVFADPTVTHFQFDIIGDWEGYPAGTFTDWKLQDNTYTSRLMYQMDAAEPVTVDGVEGFYKLTVLLDRASYLADRSKKDDLIVFRYLHGGAVKTNFYIDNLKPITAIFDPTYTVQAAIDEKYNGDTKAVVNVKSNNFTLLFNEDFLYNAFITKGAESISFTMSAEGYDIYNFATNYNRLSVWFNDGTQVTNISWDYLDYTIENGDATMTLTKDSYHLVFNEDGTLKTSITINNVTYENIVGAGLRLIGQYDTDGAGTLGRIPACVWTFSNITLNYAQAE